MSRSAAIAVPPSLPGFCPLTEAVDVLAEAGREERGAQDVRHVVCRTHRGGDGAGETMTKVISEEALAEYVAR